MNKIVWTILLPLTFFLFCFCWVALIAGAVLGYIIGIRMARKWGTSPARKGKDQEEQSCHLSLPKRRNTIISSRSTVWNRIYKNLTEESELYKERVSDLEYYKRKVRENEQVIERLSSASSETVELPVDAFSLLLQLKQDPVRTNLSRQEWMELLRTTDLLFNNFLTELKQKSGITRHEEEICCLIKWNFPRKDQMAVFNNTTDALTKSKSRLKKRLQLDEKTDLDQFIRMY